MAEGNSLADAVDDFGARLKKSILIMLVIHGIVVSGATVALVKLI